MPLDRCPHVLQSTSPHPTQSSLHRGLQDRGIGRLQGTKAPKKPMKKFKADRHFNIGIAELQTAEGKATANSR